MAVQDGIDHVVVLGATNPTGLAMARTRAEKGEALEILARTPEQAELIALRLGQQQAVHTSSLDFLEHSELERLALHIVKERGSVDHVIVCLRYGSRGDTVWGSEGEITEVYTAMAQLWLPLLPEGGSFQFFVCGDRPSVGLQPQGPCLVRHFDALRDQWPHRRLFLVAAGPDDLDVAALSSELSGSSERESERIVMPGAFVNDPSWDELMSARAALDVRLGKLPRS